jgi:hypothetical protein
MGFFQLLTEKFSTSYKKFPKICFLLKDYLNAMFLSSEKYSKSLIIKEFERKAKFKNEKKV